VRKPASKAKTNRKPHTTPHCRQEIQQYRRARVKTHASSQGQRRRQQVQGGPGALSVLKRSPPTRSRKQEACALGGSRPRIRVSQEPWVGEGARRENRGWA
ncbi:hypothetical protein LY78DRAFT_697791, partial [Colletotrichum sublineola]